MTQNYDPPASTPVTTGSLAGPAEAAQGTADTMKEQAAELGRSGADAGRHAASGIRPRPPATP